MLRQERESAERAISADKGSRSVADLDILHLRAITIILPGNFAVISARPAIQAWASFATALRCCGEPLSILKVASSDLH